ncbi:uncharacterized protein LY89DRAFT_35470 [Mollisia scopiformis]|uniref:Uncharacterized protein n=1 Tax=Mollisia scopiformis TaxID=149040 RepID=A0A194XE40_MOLSC|nr:uncharacterized protein LY89DRAFT_35470 [Mollisia scopiformis]KUJ18022.1 hypothetical protein LY89DRAFT_35470 [Mollisia scopiformis]
MSPRTTSQCPTLCNALRILLLRCRKMPYTLVSQRLTSWLSILSQLPPVLCFVWAIASACWLRISSRCIV